MTQPNKKLRTWLSKSPSVRHAVNRSARFLVALLVLVPTATLGADLGCKGNPHLLGTCYATRGSVLMSGDLAYVFAPAEGRGEFAVRDAPGSKKEVHSLMRMIMTNPITTVFTGAFVVCPIPAQPDQFPPGWVKYLCIDSATHLVAHPFDETEDH